MKRILKSELDKFYTKQEVAISLINKLDIDSYELVVDPSCGDGAFYSNIHTINVTRNRIGIDIEPHIEPELLHTGWLDDGVLTDDFLTWDYSEFELPDRSKVLVISNPPFGKQGSLAMKFINKASEFADTIAFILPLSFAKESVKNRIPKYYHLEYQEILPENSFLLDGEDFEVKCVFQIWKRKDFIREKTIGVGAKGFKYTKNKYEAHLAVRRVGVNAGQTFIETADKSEQSHYFIILDNPALLTNVVNYLNNTNWVDLTVGPRSISKPELNEKINHLFQHRH